MSAPPKPDTSKPPQRPPAVPQKLAKAKPGEAPKELTKQQRNQILARERRKAEEEAAKRKAALDATMKDDDDTKKGSNDKKRKRGDSSDSDSASSSSSDSEDESPKKPAASSSSSSSSAPLPSHPLVDVTGMDLATAKKAIAEAKRKMRAEKKAAHNAAAEAKGAYENEHELQLMHRDQAAVKLWELYMTDRKERGEELTPIERDAAIPGKGIAQLPGGNKLENHSFKLLHRCLKSMYGDKFQEQVCGGTIQPALSTKAERHAKKKARMERKEGGDEEEVEKEEEEEVLQIQKHIDDPTIGAPYVVFVSPSAIRCVEIGRGFKQIQMNTRIVKLFAKHLKIDQQREELGYDVRVAIGTPNRLLKLSQNGFLKWNRVRLIVWDIGKTRKHQVAEDQEKRRVKNKFKQGKITEVPEHIEVKPEDRGHDRKMFTMLELKDVKSELWKLYQQFLHEVVVVKQTAKLVLL